MDKPEFQLEVYINKFKLYFLKRIWSLTVDKGVQEYTQRKLLSAYSNTFCYTRSISDRELMRFLRFRSKKKSKSLGTITFKEVYEWFVKEYNYGSDTVSIGSGREGAFGRNRIAR